MCAPMWGHWVHGHEKREADAMYKTNTTHSSFAYLKHSIRKNDKDVSLSFNLAVSIYESYLGKQQQGICWSRSDPAAGFMGWAQQQQQQTYSNSGLHTRTSQLIPTTKTSLAIDSYSYVTAKLIYSSWHSKDKAVASKGKSALAVCRRVLVQLHTAMFCYPLQFGHHYLYKPIQTYSRQYSINRVTY